MENTSEWDHKNVVNELKQGRELAKLLQIHLNAASSSHETREFLVNKILISYDKVLAMLNGSGKGGEPPLTGMTIGGISESARSHSGSPRSEDSDHDFKDFDNKDSSKKRKSMPRWTQQVQISQGTGLEGPLDDGYNWRKYGQKDILGAKYPRGYYRCTHRNAQGCLATKQVQRSDEDPTIFEITYRGRHTCSQSPNPLIPPPQPPQKQDQQQLVTPHHQQQPREMLMSFQTDLKVITENLDNREQSFPSFHLPSTSNSDVENYGFFPSVLGNNLPANFSHSPTQMGSYRETHNYQTTDCELSEIISAATSATNSPTVGLEFPFGQLEFGSNFTFDNSGFFS